MTKKTEDTGVDTPDTMAVDVGVMDANLKYSDHLNQRFGNLPANPKHAGDVSEPSELLVHTTNNMNGTVGNAVATVPKEMVGDYCRAGWSKAGPMDRAAPADAVGPGSGPTDDAAGAKAQQLTDDIASGKVKPEGTA